MAPPKLSQVDISSLDDLRLREVFNSKNINRNLLETDPTERAKAQVLQKTLKGTDLYYNAKKHNFLTVAQGKTHVVSIAEEAKFVDGLRAADTNGDKVLTAEEISPHIPQDMNPEEFLGGLQAEIAKRYGPMAKNMRAWDSDAKYGPTLELLQVYSDGLFMEDTRQAQAFLKPNKVLKTLGNIPLTPLAGIHNMISDQEVNPFMMNNWFMIEAETARDNRDLALLRLKEVLEEGAKHGEEWVETEGIEGAIQKLYEMGSDTEIVDHQEYTLAAQTIEEKLPATRLFEIMTMKNKEEREEALFAFAKAERPDIFFGWFGGGNTDHANWTNLSGTRNNFMFASSISQALANQQANEDLQTRARENQYIMVGAQGSLGNVLFSPFSDKSSKAWSDLYKQEFQGRVFNWGIGLLLAPAGLRGVKDFHALKHSFSPQAVGNLMLRGWLPGWLEGLALNPKTWYRLLMPWRGMGSTRAKNVVAALNHADETGEVLTIGGKKVTTVFGKDVHFNYGINIPGAPEVLQSLPFRPMDRTFSWGLEKFLGLPPMAWTGEKLAAIKEGVKWAWNHPKVAGVTEPVGRFSTRTGRWFMNNPVPWAIYVATSEAYLLPENDRTPYPVEEGQVGADHNYNPYETATDIDLTPRISPLEVDIHHRPTEESQD